MGKIFGLRSQFFCCFVLSCLVFGFVQPVVFAVPDCVAVGFGVARKSSGGSFSDAGGERWFSPSGARLRVVRGFLKPHERWLAGHRGIDIAGVSRDVFAPAAGRVEFVGFVVSRPVLTVRVSETLVYSLEPVVGAVRVGDWVSRGQRLGGLAALGHCGEGCLHLGVRERGEYVNPLRFFWGRPVLLPWAD